MPFPTGKLNTCEPLLAIADLAGGDWPEAARSALVELCAKGQADDDSIGVKLLRDIKAVFYPRDDDGHRLPERERITSSDLVDALGKMVDRPWAEYGKPPKPITQPGVARILARYEILPKNIRFDGRVAKGYEREQFTEAWKRYLPPDSVYEERGIITLSPFPFDLNRYTATTRINVDESRLFESATPGSCSGSENAVSVNKDAPCSGVADEKGGVEVRWTFRFGTPRPLKTGEPWPGRPPRARSEAAMGRGESCS